MTPPLRAPREDGGIVVRPSLDEVPELIRANQARLRRVETPLLGWPLTAMRSAARYEVLAEARAYHREAGEPLPDADSHVVVMAGHQPELFHPGVWVKNFALAGLASRYGVTAVNLIVDNDTQKSTDLRVPSLTTGGEPWPHVESVKFDLTGGEVPYEEATVRDEALFASLPSRVAEVTADWPFKPLLPELWSHTGGTPLLGERLARARRAVERSWGCHNLEVPVSRLCRTEPFVWFASHLLGELPRFHALYNEVVRDYRKRHGVRSRNHPVPDLAAEGDWREAPFWAWRSGSGRRGRLMVRRTGGALQLRVGGEAWPDLPLEGEPLPRAFQQLEREGVKVRPRALTNTLFARLLLCDLFVHGIGGGLYDELTDELLRQFYGVEPPSYLVLSATLLLPLPTFPVTADDERRLAQTLRDQQWNPQRHLVGGEMIPLVRERTDWINRRPRDRAERRERFRRLRENLDLLRPRVAPLTEETRVRHGLFRRQVQANADLRRRDYAFCLYPEPLLRPFCKRFTSWPLPSM